MRQANDRGYECLLLSNCSAAAFPETYFSVPWPCFSSKSFLLWASLLLWALNLIPKNCWWEIWHFFEADKRFEIKVGDHDINDIHDARLLRCIRPWNRSKCSTAFSVPILRWSEIAPAFNRFYQPMSEHGEIQKSHVMCFPTHWFVICWILGSTIHKQVP